MTPRSVGTPSIKAPRLLQLLVGQPLRSLLANFWRLVRGLVRNRVVDEYRGPLPKSAVQALPGEDVTHFEVDREVPSAPRTAGEDDDKGRDSSEPTEYSEPEPRTPPRPR
jgi:hypothetical protein